MTGEGVANVLLWADLVVGLTVMSYLSWRLVRLIHPMRWKRERASRRRRARMKAAGLAARLALIDRNLHRAEARKRERDEWDAAILRAKGIHPGRPEVALLVPQPRPHPDVYRVRATQGRKHEPLPWEPVFVKAGIWEAMTAREQRRYVEAELRVRGWKG